VSSRPGTCEGIISQILGIDWHTDGARRAVRKVIAENPDLELEQFCEKVRRRHNETSNNFIGDGPYSWRDFRNYTASIMFEDKYDRERIMGLVKEKLEEVENE